MNGPGVLLCIALDQIPQLRRMECLVQLCLMECLQALVDGLVLATASLLDELRLATALPDEMLSKLGDKKKPDWNGYTMLVTALACP